MKSQNPWYHQAQKRAWKYFDEDPGIHNEAYLGHHDPITCGNCDKNAYFKASVGAVICPRCSYLRKSVLDKATGKWTTIWVEVQY